MVIEIIEIILGIIQVMMSRIIIAPRIVFQIIIILAIIIIIEEMDIVIISDVKL